MARAVLAAFVVLVTCASWASAQVTLRGQVLDSEMGSPLTGASIRIGNSATVHKSDSLGLFEIAGLRGGAPISRSR